MTGRYLEGARPAPRAAADSPLAAAWAGALDRYGDRIERYLLHDALAELWGIVGEANRLVDAEQPWALAKAAKAGDAAAEGRLADVLGDLLEACRLVALAAAPVMPAAAPRILAQLGRTYPYDDAGNGGPPLAELLAWGAGADDAGVVGTPEPLFPRLDVEPAG
jgi:methionyl-tRNA synthetase